MQLYVPKPKCSRRFGEVDPETSHMCAPLPKSEGGRFLFFLLIRDQLAFPQGRKVQNYRAKTVPGITEAL